MTGFSYVYRWDRQGRKGQPCAVLARGTMNSCLVVFADGYKMVTSINAIAKNRAISCDRTKSHTPRKRSQIRLKTTDNDLDLLRFLVGDVGLEPTTR